MGIWHTYSTRRTLSELEADEPRGLSGVKVEWWLARWGPNRLEGGRRQGLLLRFLGQMKDSMILVLLAAAALSLWASGGEDWLDATAILVIVTVNACISISQKDSAEKTLETLRKMSAPLAKVVRNGALRRLKTDRLAPGDIIHLETEDLVPADARTLGAASFRTDESAMIGGSVPVSKGLLLALPGDTPLAKRHNIVLASTIITQGRAVHVVIGASMDTEMGRIAGLLLGEGEGQTPLQKKTAEISKTLSFICLYVCTVMSGVGLLQGRPMLDIFLAIASLAVTAIPEGLSAIVTIVLALGVVHTTRRRAIVKRLPAVETLGRTGVICSGKTDTLTQNRMAVVSVWAPRSGERALALIIEVLCSDTALAWKGREPISTGDLTETALVDAAAREDLDENGLGGEWPRWGELPFDSGRKPMTTVHRRLDDGWRVRVGGAPDALARQYRLDSAAARQLESRGEVMVGRALRALGVAYKDLTILPRELNSAALEQELTFMGLIGMTDPPRPKVRTAVEQCYAAGIKPVMITGDHRLTAVAIVRELNIYCPGDLALTGESPNFLPQEVLEQEVEEFSVYARVSPEHKMRIIKARQARGKVMAITGDGVNDTLALKAADISCAMRITGIGVTKGAAGMILTGDNFTTTIPAVEQGRGICVDIKKVIHHLLSYDIGEILIIFCATVFYFH